MTCRLRKSVQLPPGSGKAEFRIQDFFAFKVPDEERFDIIYDYTYVVLLHRENSIWDLTLSVV